MTEKNKATDQVKEQLVTYEIYAAMPDDGQRYEIVDGSMELMSPGPSTNHQAISGELEFILKQSCKSEYVIYDAPLDVILSQTNVFQPDIIMIHRNRLHIVTARGIEGAPDLVVEILFPGSRKRDKVTKMKKYAQYGINEYWIVDSIARTLEQYQLIDNGLYELRNLFEANDIVTSDKLPCVSFVIDDIFKEILS
ncbi:Uma2 family endonuclease [Paenibacillus psychroresistens]|uniref:Uma2 family endonuclease n=1 Tax=Paenibacillus psychroresistens TaxID=1778678 RepID=A0A6B8RW47_9BACL|nr:Uma2 family endonuclease [Paenibacillus psychroresistens]QGQ99436.1 Uma2 family endonuclease [Paenibacillus psychroresistens]